MRRTVGMTAAMLLITALLFPSSTFADAKEPSSTRVFSDLHSYENAVTLANEKRSAFEGYLSDEEKLQRAKEVSEALSRVHDVASLEKIAEEYDLYIYDPNLQSQDISTLSIENDVSYTRPRIIWDNSIQWEYYNAEWTWKSIAPLSYEQGPFQNHGGVDSTGLNFSNVPVPLRLAGYWVRTYDNGGNARDYLTSRSYAPYSDGKMAILFNGQDKYITVSVPIYTWYSAEIWVYFSYRLSAAADGFVEAVYAHTWKETAVSGASFTVEGDPENKVSGGLTIEFTINENKWVGASLPTDY